MVNLQVRMGVSSRTYTHQLKRQGQLRDKMRRFWHDSGCQSSDLMPEGGHLMTTIPQLSQRMKHLLTTTADHLARTTGFTQRRSPLSGSRFARILVFSWWENPAATCQDRAALARVLDCPVSAWAIEHRRTARAAGFLRALLGAAVQTAVRADPVALPVLARFSAVAITDG